MIDPLDRLAHLPLAQPAPERADRRRQRCRVELARRARRPEAGVAGRDRHAGSPLWQAAVASLCLAYVAEVIALAVDVLHSR